MRAISCGRVWRDQALSKNILYFAYGSNLNQEDLDKWKARKSEWKNTDLTLDKKSIGFLPGYRLGFTRISPNRGNKGVADIVPSDDPMSRVWGVIFSLTEEQSKAIGAKEGFYGVGNSKNSYEQIRVEVTDVHGARVRHPCLTYQAIVQGGKPRQATYFEPHLDYIKAIYSGGEDHQLPREFFYHLRMVSEASWVV
jgi:hypothetical protein